MRLNPFIRFSLHGSMESGWRRRGASALSVVRPSLHHRAGAGDVGQLLAIAQALQKNQFALLHGNGFVGRPFRPPPPDAAPLSAPSRRSILVVIGGGPRHQRGGSARGISMKSVAGPSITAPTMPPSFIAWVTTPPQQACLSSPQRSTTTKSPGRTSRVR